MKKENRQEVTATYGQLHLKSFDRAFSKARRVLGQRPESRPQARNLSNGISFGSFLCASGIKEKNGEGFLT